MFWNVWLIILTGSAIYFYNRSCGEQDAQSVLMNKIIATASVIILSIFAWNMICALEDVLSIIIPIVVTMPAIAAISMLLTDYKKPIAPIIGAVGLLSALDVGLIANAMGNDAYMCTIALGLALGSIATLISWCLFWCCFFHENEDGIGGTIVWD